MFNSTEVQSDENSGLPTQAEPAEGGDTLPLQFPYRPRNPSTV